MRKNLQQLIFECTSTYKVLLMHNLFIIHAFVHQKGRIDKIEVVSKTKILSDTKVLITQTCLTFEILSKKNKILINSNPLV